MKLGFILANSTLILLLMSCGNTGLRSSDLNTAESSEISSLKAALADAPVGVRYGHSSVMIGRKMLVWGGLENPGKLPRIGFHEFKSDGAMFDFDTKSWTMLPASPLTPRFNHAAVAVGNKMIITGGLSEEAGFYRYFPAKGSAIFDLDKMEWTLISGIPDGQEGLGQYHTLAGTSKFVAMSLNDRENIFLCCMGNTRGTYNITNDRWVSRTASNAAYIPERRNQSAVYYNGKIFVFGGETAEYRGVSYNMETAAFAFDPRLDHPREYIPTEGPNNLLYGISNHTAVTHKDKMIVYGGNQAGGPGSRLGIFDFNSKSWDWKKGEDKKFLKTGHTAIVIDHRMVIWGGASDENFSRASVGTNPLILNLENMNWE